MPMPAGLTKPVEICQIKVTLHDSHPPIWRRIQVRSDTTLAKLHRILQRVIGWEDAHLHQFVIREERYGVPDEEDVGPRKARDERKYKLSDVVPAPKARSFGTTTTRRQLAARAPGREDLSARGGRLVLRVPAYQIGPKAVW